MNSVVNNFLNNKNDEDDLEYIIPSGFFDEDLPVVLVEISFCDKNEFVSKQFIKKFNSFTQVLYDLRVQWFTKKTKTLFRLKDPCIHPVCKIYKGVCSCGKEYIGETVRNVEMRWNEHNKPSDKSNPSKHLVNNIQHYFIWSVICSAPTKKLTRKILEAYYIALYKPFLNDQIDSDLLNLFKHGVT